MIMRLRVNNDVKYPGRFPYVGHVYGFQVPTPTQFEMGVFLFPEIDLTTDQIADIDIKLNRWNFNGTGLSELPEIYWNVTEEEVEE